MGRGQADKTHRDDGRRWLPSVSRRAFACSLIAGVAALPGCALEGLAPSGSDADRASVKSDVPTIYDSAAPVKTATLMMVGDMLIHRSVWQSGEREDGTYNYDHLFTHMADEFADADIAMVNQETILGGTEHGLEDFPYFNSPQELGDAEVKAGVDVAVSATNHALDHGYEGICWTVEYWREHHPEVLVPGIADTEKVARTPKIIERNGIKVAILSYTAYTNELYPPSDKTWCLNVFETSDIDGDVERAREAGADIVVACPHWGEEYVHEPHPTELKWAGVLLDAGVDAIIGTHPHVIQPVEVLEGADGKQVPVFWSLGNYISSQVDKPRMVGGMAKLTFEKTSAGSRVVEYSMTPLVTHRAWDDSMGVYLLSEYTDELAEQNVVRYSDGCGDFSVAYCEDLVAEVLGEAYDPDAYILRGTL
ncbi:CapA family protein [Collinsella tanakaei]|uniref:CapA family protein n=1 Tax=Collinsella tanakaei TaxID=626935 RepID=UPI001F2F75D6|nr:CapA family protein [Collinsella tanakaei]MCF2622236.1 CapA family protein [Collinsella tanakaei]